MSAAKFEGMHLLRRLLATGEVGNLIGLKDTFFMLCRHSGSKGNTNESLVIDSLVWCGGALYFELSQSLIKACNLFSYAVVDGCDLACVLAGGLRDLTNVVNAVENLRCY